MRYRQLSPTGDYTVNLPFLHNTPTCVAQAVLTRLKLFTGDWFIDTTDGLPFYQSIAGKQYGTTPDAYIKQRILGTPGVLSLASYTSVYDGAERSYTVTCAVNTIYGTSTPITVTLP